MSEMIDLAYDSAKEDMQKAMDRLDTELRKIRAGKAHPSMLDSVKVDYEQQKGSVEKFLE